MKLRFKRLVAKNKLKKPFDVCRLKNEDCRSEYQLELRNKFDGLDLISEDLGRIGLCLGMEYWKPHRLL